MKKLDEDKLKPTFHLRFVGFQKINTKSSRNRTDVSVCNDVHGIIYIKSRI